VLHSTAVVVTDAPARYAKQLLAHLGRKNTVEMIDGAPDAGRLLFAYGTGTVRPEDGRLVLVAVAADADALARVEDVLGRHLERFGARRELVVTWQRPDPRPGPAPRSTGAHVQVIHTDDAPSHAGPVPQAVEAGGWVYVSALFGAVPNVRTIPEDARAEAEQLFANLAAILAAAGATLTDVVRVGIVMRDLQRDRPVFNAVWAEQFGDHRPARSAIQSPDFGREGENARFMIEVAAYRG
jgi:enamine deaminase RidA (YjgF/YER057c/UK114 family)